MEFSLAWVGCDRHDLFDKNRWRTLFSSSSSRTSRAYDATKKKSFATSGRIDTDNRVHDVIYENEENGLRFQPTKAGDEGAFIDGLPVNQNVEMDSEVRDMCDRGATCNQYMGREKVMCRTCFKSVHDFCVGEHVHQPIRGTV